MRARSDAPRPACAGLSLSAPRFGSGGLLLCGPGLHVLHAHHERNAHLRECVTARAARTSGVARSPLSPGPGVRTEFELKQGEVVKFNDFLKALPKAEENEAEDDDEEEGLIKDKDLAVL